MDPRNTQLAEQLITYSVKLFTPLLRGGWKAKGKSSRRLFFILPQGAPPFRRLREGVMRGLWSRVEFASNLAIEPIFLMFLAVTIVVFLRN